MIKAEEAIQLANSYKDNYRKQERIALENKVSAEVEKAARNGKYKVMLSIDYQDKDYIIEKVQSYGFQVGNVCKRDESTLYSVEIMWNPAATPKTTGRSLAQEFLKRLEQKP